MRVFGNPVYAGVKLVLSSIYQSSVGSKALIVSLVNQGHSAWNNI
jgi:hypothetical protein